MDGLTGESAFIKDKKQSMRAASPDSHLYPDFFFSPSTSEREKTDDFFIHVVVVVHG